MTTFTQKEMRIAREKVIGEFIADGATIGGEFEFQGIGVDGPIFADATGRTIVLKVIAKKEIGIFEDLIAEKAEKEAAAVARAEEAKAKKAKREAKAAKAEVETEVETEVTAV